MSTDTSIVFVPVGTVIRENTTDYSEEWLKLMHSTPHYLEQHRLPVDCYPDSDTRLFDCAYMAAPFNTNQRWQNILGYAHTDLRNLSGLTIDEDLIERALSLYTIITSLINDPDIDLQEFERLLEQHKGQEFYIYC